MRVQLLYTSLERTQLVIVANIRPSVTASRSLWWPVRVPVLGCFHNWGCVENTVFPPERGCLLRDRVKVQLGL